MAIARPPKIKQDKKLKFTLFNKKERSYWKNLDINIESFCDIWLMLAPKLENEFAKFDELQQSTICKAFNLKKAHIDQSYSDLLQTNRKACIELYCIMSLVTKHKLNYSRIWNIPKRKGKTNTSAVYLKALEEHLTIGLSNAYMLNFARKRGTARYSFDLQATDNINTLDKARKILESLIRHMNIFEKRKYYLRYVDKDRNSDDYYFLLMRSVSDEIVPAIPDNIRLIKDGYLLIQIDLLDSKVFVHSGSPKESARIKRYVARRAGTKAKYTRDIAEYDPAKFFAGILGQTPASELQLIDACFRKHNLGDNSMLLQDNHKKNNIIETIQELKNKKVINLTDFSEFKSLEFFTNNLKFHLDVQEDRWGQLKLHLRDRGKPHLEVASFRRNFEKIFDIPVDKFLRNRNVNVEKTTIVRKLLEKTTIDAAIPPEVDEILIELINNKILAKPVSTTKRRCDTCYEIFWKDTECPNCAGDAFFEGEYIDIQVNTEAISNLILKYLKKRKIFSAAKTTKQIEKTIFSFIELLTKSGESLSIHISTASPSEKLTAYFQETGNPLLVIILRYRDGIIRDIQKKGFECFDFADIYYSLSDDTFEEKLRAAMQSQKNKWKERLLAKGYQSYERYSDRDNQHYNDQLFEKDVYNMLHEIFAIGDRLGGQFIGVTAPDGIISVQNYSIPFSRYCFTWDCKYSVSPKGYKLSDKASKHRHYINVLKKNDKVLFYGGLKSYIIISQNMDMASYQKFYERLTSKFRWTGNVIYLEADLLAGIYRVFRDNAELIHSYPSIFYKKLFNLFRSVDKIDSVPYQHITRRKTGLMLDRVQSELKTKKRKFEFERKEFN